MQMTEIVKNSFVDMAGMLPNGNGVSPETVEGTVNNAGNVVNPKSAYVKILEQPASKALRFRYECEGRSAGSIPGAHNTPENKTYPTIQIVGYKGRAVVVVSCVTKDEPYRTHPHNLVGKECKEGVCTVKIDNETMTATFSNLGIQCVKKKDIEEALRIRENKRVDPFRQGFSHSAHPSSIDLNAVRLCFQGFLELEISERQKWEPLTPVVSDPIYDKKAMSDLVITKLSHSSASVAGGQEIILLCEKVAKEDIQVRFYEELNGLTVWEAYGEFPPSQVHKQVAIYFKTPQYRNTEVDRKVKVLIQLRRPSDGAMSEPLPFHFVPDDSGCPHPKKRRLPDQNVLIRQPAMQNALFRVSPQPVNPLFAVSPRSDNFQPVKEEPCGSVFGSPPPAGSPYDHQMPSPSNYSPNYPNQINYGQENNQLPPFNDLPGSHLKQEPVGGNYNYLNYPSSYGNNLGLSHSLNEYLTLNSATTTTNNNSVSPMYVNDSQINNEIQSRNDNAVISLELKLDSKDLVGQMDAALSENLEHSLNISDYTPGETNMTDSLTKLANDTVEKLQHMNQL